MYVSVLHYRHLFSENKTWIQLRRNTIKHQRFSGYLSEPRNGEVWRCGSVLVLGTPRYRQAKKAEFQAAQRDTNELVLFHGTQMANTHAICTGNFNLDLSKRF